MKDLKYWLALNKIPSLGPVRIKRLLEHFGSVKKIWEAKATELSKVPDMGTVTASKVIKARSEIDPDEELNKVSDQGIKIITQADPSYPENLKNIYDPPPVLYMRGDLKKEDKKAIAIVGTRKESFYGHDMAKAIAKGLVEAGLTIVSGMARGIDTAAHLGALEAKGRTIAVLGSGIDVIYPPQNEELASRITHSGALISEFPLGVEPDKGNFPRRNRIISGLSLGVVVVEGTHDSGSLITAKLALEQGREVFAIPGRIDSQLAQGPHSLIKEGAKLVESVEDILEELNIPISKEKSAKGGEEKKDYSNLPPNELKIINSLSKEPKHIDLVGQSSKLSVSEVSSLLMVLEVKGLVRQLPGKRFILV